jgi:hypothetical protein
MDVNGRPAVQVVINGHQQAQQAYGPTMAFQNQHNPQSRPLSVDEALQYSSMSSAPVFGLGPSLYQFPPNLETEGSSNSLLTCRLRDTPRCWSSV